jgi:hypothetical protein
MGVIITKKKPPMAPGPGRPKGSPNKLTRQAKIVLQQAFEELGGVERLVEWASKSQRHYGEFLRLWARLLPREVRGGPSVDEERFEVLEAAKRRADAMCARITAEISESSWPAG